MDLIVNNNRVFPTEKIEELSKHFNLSSIVVELLYSRGYKTVDEINNFLNPSEKNFYDPFLLSGMQDAVDRINLAIKNNEKVLIFGDYDVDGVSASAILIKYFSNLNFYVDYYLPNRYIDGYGLTNEVLDKIKKEFSPTLIITVDCGISCKNEIEYAKQIGIDIIVTDHHDIPEELPNTIVVNAKLPNQKYPFSQLCGTGVAFKLVQALAGLEEAKKYLAICALATISDIVPLLDENRAIVKLGIKNFEKDLPLGIKMLIKDNKLNFDLSASDISYRLSPKINAAGRMGDAGVALKLFIKKDKVLLKNTIDNLNDLNINRQALCNQVYDDAISKLNKINLSNYKCIVLYSKKWDSGILGIVSAKIAGEFNKPTILFSEVGDELKGSARSINEINIFETISSIKEVVEAFGGHKMAAGLTIKTKNFNEFLRHLNESLTNSYTPKDFLPYSNYDYDLNVNEITQKFVNDLDVLEPCGCANPKPLFNINLEKANVSPLSSKFPNHINISTKNINIIAFNSYKYMPLLKLTNKQQVLVELQNSTYKNKTYIKGIAKNIFTGKIENLKLFDTTCAEYLKQLAYNEKSKDDFVYSYDEKEFENIVSQTARELFGTLYIANTYESYNYFIEKIEDNLLFAYHNIFEIVQNNGVNTILLAPNNFKNFNAYKNIIFLDQVLSTGYLNKIQKTTRAKIYVPKNKKINNNIFGKLSCDRQVFANYFKMISKFIAEMPSCASELEFFKQLRQKNPNVKNLTYSQFIFCFYTFIELGIFDIKIEQDFLSIKENKKVFSELKNSKFYNNVNLIVKTF